MSPTGLFPAHTRERNELHTPKNIKNGDEEEEEEEEAPDLFLAPRPPSLHSRWLGPQQHFTVMHGLLPGPLGH